MDNNTQIEVRVLIQQLLGMPENSVRPADVSQPTTGSEYAIVQLTDMEAQGWGGSSKDAYQTGIATLTIDFMGDRAARNARALPLAMQTHYAVDTLIGLNIGYLGCSSARDLTSLEIERISRYQIKMQLSYTTRYEQPPQIPDTGNIETVPIGMIAEP